MSFLLFFLEQVLHDSMSPEVALGGGEGGKEEGGGEEEEEEAYIRMELGD